MVTIKARTEAGVVTDLIAPVSDDARISEAGGWIGVVGWSQIRVLMAAGDRVR